MSSQRASGILLHPTSLPGPYGIGDLGPTAFAFVDLLKKAGQTFWQILPLGPTGHGNSPYSLYSAFAGNTLLISSETISEDGLITQGTLKACPSFPSERVDFEKVIEWKTAMLAEAFAAFRSSGSTSLRDEYDAFCSENFWWLDDYAIFRAVKTSHNDTPWNAWAEPLRRRDKTAIATIGSQLAREIQAEKFAQFLFFRQWAALKKYANDKGVSIIGDIPIFVAHDSADVWCNQELFKLNPDGSPKVVAGVPPDYFSETGQLWGNPIYDWDAMRVLDFGWWTARIAFALRMTDAVRLDHFIGFVRNWEVPGGDKTAENGNWASVPGREFFTMLRSRIGHLPVIAEDLGSLTPEVENLRDEFGFPGMRILQYAFGGDAYNRDLPHNYPQNCVAYTGTHDNDTTAGWYASAPKNVKTHCRTYLQISGRNVHWDMIRAALASVADTAIIPAQDLLGLDSNSRINTPATASGNWEWRLEDGQLSDDVCEKLLELTITFGRTNSPEQ